MAMDNNNNNNSQQKKVARQFDVKENSTPSFSHSSY